MTGSLQKRYEHLATDRQPFLDRGRDCAVLTIPTLLPEDGHNSSSEFATPYQAIGARGVNNLASKLLLALLPPNSPFFRLVISDTDLKELGAKARGEVEAGLSRIERMAMSEVETKALRVPVFEAIKHLIVAGNSLVYLDKEGVAKVFRLDRYVVKRDAMGNVLEIITKETVDLRMLEPDVRMAVLQQDNAGADPKDLIGKYINEGDTNGTPLDLYTGIILTSKGYEVHQEINGVVIPKSKGVYQKDKLPFIPLRFTRIDGEDYGRGYIEEYLGDLISLEELTKAIVEGSAASAKVLFLIAPNGTTKASALAKAANGAFVSGNANDVHCLQVGKSGDFSVALQTMQMINDRLSFAFLLNSAAQRQAERVTAEEIRFIAQEIEAALGGVYSTMSQEFQLPLVTLVLNSLQAQKKTPKLPKEVKPVIVTGVEALGRGQDLNKLATFLQYLQPLGADVIAKEINITDYISRLGASLGIDTLGLVKTEEEKQAEMEQAQAAQQEMMMQQTMSQMAQRGAPEMVKQEYQEGSEEGNM